MGEEGEARIDVAYAPLLPEVGAARRPTATVVIVRSMGSALLTGLLFSGGFLPSYLMSLAFEGYNAVECTLAFIVGGACAGFIEGIVRNITLKPEGRHFYDLLLLQQMRNAHLTRAAYVLTASLSGGLVIAGTGFREYNTDLVRQGLVACFFISFYCLTLWVASWVALLAVCALKIDVDLKPLYAWLRNNPATFAFTDNPKLMSDRVLHQQALGRSREMNEENGSADSDVEVAAQAASSSDSLGGVVEAHEPNSAIIESEGGHSAYATQMQKLNDIKAMVAVQYLGGGQMRLDASSMSALLTNRPDLRGFDAVAARLNFVKVYIYRKQYSRELDMQGCMHRCWRRYTWSKRSTHVAIELLQQNGGARYLSLWPAAALSASLRVLQRDRRGRFSSTVSADGASRLMTKAWDESWYRGDGCSVEVFSLSTLHIENILRTADKFAEGGRFNWKYAPLSLLNHSAEQNCSGLVASLLIAGGIQAMVPELGYLDASIYPAESRLPWLDYRLGYFLYVVQFGLDWERRNPAFLIAVGGLLVSVLSGRIVDTHTRLIRKAVLEINYGPLFFVLGSYFSGMLLLQENCRNLGVGVFVGTVLVAYSGYLLYTALDSLARWITGLLSFSQGVVTPSLLRKVLLQAEYAETGYTRTHQALVRGVKGVMVFVWYVLSALESGFLALTNIDADRQTLATVRILLMFFYALRLHYARARMMDEWREDAEKKELLPEDQASYYEFSSLSNNPHFIASAFILFDMVFFIRKDYSPSAAGWLEAFSSFALTKNEQIDLAFMVGSLFVLVGVFRMLEHMSSKHDGHPRFWLVPKPYSRERMDPDLFSAYRVR